jgi:hypothetical protein
MWKQRLDRDEVFSRHYKPTPEEEKELKDVASFVGANSSNSKDLFNPEEKPRSILLKRGPILLAITSSSTNQRLEERELIMLTHGFVLAKVVTGILALARLISRALELAELYEDVEYVRDNPMTKQPSFVVKTTSQEFHFYCSSLKSKHYWLDAWERVLVQNRLRSKHRPTKIGWQHELVQTSLFTAAVTGSAATLQSATTNSNSQDGDPNALDKYNQLGVLHYAVMNHQNHILEYLLEDGKAFFDLPDGDGRTPMYYAQRDGNHEAVELLKKFGASSSDLYDLEQHGELTRDVKEFDEQQRVRLERQKRYQREVEEAEFKAKLEAMRADGTSSNGKDKKGNFFRKLSHHKEEVESSAAAKDAQDKTASAKTAMNENMRLIQERGEKINELKNRTDRMENNVAEYAELAAQLKAKSKAKKWYNLK